MIMYKKQVMKSTKIFLVDDDLFSLNIYRQALDSLGYKDISLFLNGTICLSNLHQKPNIIFLNYQMCDNIGLDLLKKIKRYSSSIYIVIFSANENINDASEALKFGAFDYIIKGDNEIAKMNYVIERIFAIERNSNI